LKKKVNSSLIVVVVKFEYRVKWLKYFAIKVVFSSSKHKNEINKNKNVALVKNPTLYSLKFKMI